MNAQAIVFGVFQVFWSFWWWRLHDQARKYRIYSHQKIPTGTDPFYKIIGPFLFLQQLFVTLLCLGTDHSWNLEFANSFALRLAGCVCLVFFGALYWFSLRSLGNEYSPCYDRHMPTHKVTTGPYAFLKHPMYLSKVGISFGSLLLSSSLWMFPALVYMSFVCFRTAHHEDHELESL